MSANPGKIEILGTPMIGEQRVFALKMVQARNPAWTQELFFAEYDEDATWVNQLRPIKGQSFPWES